MTKKLLFKVRTLIVFFICGLLVSGITAFPLEWELSTLCHLLNIPITDTAIVDGGLSGWLAQVMLGLTATGQHYPFLFYGTDWLAFAHIVIAALFVGPLINPERNVWVIYWGMFACLAVIPTAFICGSIRGIPFFWQLIDCSFGVIGIIPLWMCLHYIRRIKEIGISYK